MRKISEVAAQSLSWEQPKALKKWFELRAGAECIATLEFRSLFGSFATGESADGCWTLKRAGFWRPRATVRACDSELDIAIFTDKTWSGGGTLRFADGREMLASSSFWKSRLAFQAPDGGELFLITPRGLLHFGALVEIHPRARKMKELPWLLMLAWYVAILHNEDEAASSAAAASA